MPERESEQAASTCKAHTQTSHTKATKKGNALRIHKWCREIKA